MKYTVCHDELKIKKAGLYCFFPFERLDDNKKGVFKVGRSSRVISKRIEDYHSYFPMGVYIVFHLSYPRLQIGQKKQDLQRDMEKQLIENLTDEGGKMLIFPSRPSQKSEWIYCSFSQLRKSFLRVQEKYGGDLNEFDLKTLNATYKKNMKKKDKFVGEIVYPV